MFKTNQNLERWVNFFTNSIIGLLGAFALSILVFINWLIKSFILVVVTAWYRVKYGKAYGNPLNEFISTSLKEYDFVKNFEYSFNFSTNRVEFLFFAALFYLFSIYALLGSSSILFSNEGIWLVVLSVAVVFGNIYYQSHFANQKSNFEIQIDSITKLLSHNAELVEEISKLENSLLFAQIENLSSLEFLFIFIDNLEVQPKDLEESYSNFFEANLNKTFQDHFHYLASLTIFRENLFLSVELKDLNEEIAEEGFEN